MADLFNEVAEKYLKEQEFERCDYPNTLLAKNKHQLGVLQKQKAQSTDFCSEYCALTVVLWCDYLNLFLFKT